VFLRTSYDLYCIYIADCRLDIQLISQITYKFAEHAHAKKKMCVHGLCVCVVCAWVCAWVCVCVCARALVCARERDLKELVTLGNLVRSMCRSVLYHGIHDEIVINVFLQH
jgi:hypothetical protein